MKALFTVSLIDDLILSLTDSGCSTTESVGGETYHVTGAQVEFAHRSLVPVLERIVKINPGKYVISEVSADFEADSLDIRVYTNQFITLTFNSGRSVQQIVSFGEL